RRESGRRSAWPSGARRTVPTRGGGGNALDHPRGCRCRQEQCAKKLPPNGEVMSGPVLTVIRLANGRSRFPLAVGGLPSNLPPLLRPKALQLVPRLNPGV